jgi:hypothetical protein
MKQTWQDQFAKERLFLRTLRRAGMPAPNARSLAHTLTLRPLSPRQKAILLLLAARNRDRHRHRDHNREIANKE